MTEKKKNEKTKEGTKEVTDKEDMAVALQELFDLKESMAGVDVRLPQIGIIHQGQLYKMPDDSKIETFTGIILDISRANAFWIEPYDESGGGVPPDCFSTDGLIPNSFSGDVQHDGCPNCPQNKFGSDAKGGRGKGCKNMRRVHMLIEDNIMPYRLSVPPSSIGPVESYVSNIWATGIPYQMITTEFGLKEASNKEGIKYSEVTLKETDRKDSMEVAHFRKKMQQQWMPFMREQVVVSDEYDNVEA